MQIKREDGIDFIRALWEYMPVGAWTMDPDGIITSWNREAEQLTGYSSEETLGKPCSMLFPGRARGDGAPAHCPEHAVEGRFCEIVGKGDRKILIYRSSKPILDDDGATVGWAEIGMDSRGILSRHPEYKFKDDYGNQRGFEKIVGNHPLMLEVYYRIKLAADSNVSVIITGESGTGKELVAEAIHGHSSRSKKNFVKVNCSAIPETLLESELFGHVKGSFTGAHAGKVGRFEYADGGTIFLDEIGDISPAIQVKLLRVLQEKTFERVGESTPTATDVRIICATNRDLTGLVNRNLFREDLFYRINVFPINVPPLRSRTSDVTLLVGHFLEKIRKDTGRPISGISADCMTLLRRFPWPGNVRQLENAIEHAFVTSRGETISVFDLPQEIRDRIVLESETPQNQVRTPSIRQKDRILAALRQSDWNRTKASRILGISRVTLWKRIKELGLIDEQA